MRYFETGEEAKRFMELVKKMREYQKDYFMYKGATYLKKSKQYEHEVDKILSDIDKRVMSPAKPTQGTLL